MTSLWDKAMLCADRKTMDLCASALAQRKLLHRVRKKSGATRKLIISAGGDGRFGKILGELGSGLKSFRDSLTEKKDEPGADENGNIEPK